LTPNNLGETWRRICSLDIRTVSTLEVLPCHTIALYKSTFTYLLKLTYYCRLSWHNQTWNLISGAPHTLWYWNCVLPPSHQQWTSC